MLHTAFSLIVISAAADCPERTVVKNIYIIKIIIIVMEYVPDMLLFTF